MPYRFSVISPLEIPTTLVIKPVVGVCGDQNSDGVVNILDATIDMQIITDQLLSTQLQVILSGPDRDGRITVVDVVTLYQMTVGKIQVNRCGPGP